LTWRNRPAPARVETRCVDILFLLVPMSVVLALLVLALFAWALNEGQFDDVEGEGERILWDGTVPTRGAFDEDQARPAERAEQSPRASQGTCRP
jgi:cbb3-type cytochrome oxidase maturation protein